MQYSEGSTPGHADRRRKAGGGLHEGIVALSLVLPLQRPRGGAPERGVQALLALCPFLALGQGSRTGEPGAVPGGRGPLAMPWSEPRWWGWPAAEAPAAQSHIHGRPVVGELPTPARRAPAEGLQVLLAHLPAVRWIERASQRPHLSGRTVSEGGPRGSVSGAPFRWAMQPPIGLLPGLSRVPPIHGEDQASGGARTRPVPPDRDLPWRPAGTVSAGLPAQTAVPATPAARLAGPRHPGAAPAAPPDHGFATGTAGPVVPGVPAAGELPFGGGGALPGLAALDAVRAVPYAALRDRGAMPPARPRAAPGTGAASARVDTIQPPLAAETSARSPADPFGSSPTGRALSLPWPDPRPAAPGGAPPVQGARPLSPAENEPGPYAPAAARGLAAIADAFQAAERLVERRVKVEVARASKRVQAEVDEQLRTQGRQAAADMVSDEALQGLMQKLRALAREERFREGRLR